MILPEEKAEVSLNVSEKLSREGDPHARDVVDRADVGVIQCGCGLGCALKAGQCLRVPGDIIGQELQGHKTMEPGILGLVNHTHPATTQFLDDAVVRDGLADELGRRAHWQEC
jgi:hypothetical protein